MDLTEALSAEGGLVCVVGAGGKKSTLYALAGRLDRAVVTASVRIPIFDQHVASVRVTRDPIGAIEAAGAGDWPLGLVPERERSDRYLGYDRHVVDDIAAASPVGTTLDTEPRIPDTADVVLPVASVHAVGEPLTDALVHRPERVAAVADLDPGDRLGVGDVATVLASPEGGRKGVPEEATVIPVLNKVDDDDLERTARDIADEIHARADVPRVALTRMTADDPLVGVV